MILWPKYCKCPKINSTFDIWAPQSGLYPVLCRTGTAEIIGQPVQASLLSLPAHGPPKNSFSSPFLILIFFFRVACSSKCNLSQLGWAGWHICRSGVPFSFPRSHAFSPQISVKIFSSTHSMLKNQIRSRNKVDRWSNAHFQFKTYCLKTYCSKHSFNDVFLSQLFYVCMVVYAVKLVGWREIIKIIFRDTTHNRVNERKRVEGGGVGKKWAYLTAIMGTAH